MAPMNAKRTCASLDLPKRPLTLQGAGESSPGAKLGVNVVFTSAKATLAALKTARRLATDLQARINVVWLCAVPYSLPLDRPPVSVPFIEQQLLELSNQGVQGPWETNILLILCRDERQALLQALGPRSLVVIGSQSRWWPARKNGLAKVLRSHGHQVIFVRSK